MELLTRRFVHLPTRLLRRVVEEAQGNPLALLEFAASAGGRKRQRPHHRDVRIEPPAANAVPSEDRAAP